MTEPVRPVAHFLDTESVDLAASPPEAIDALLRLDLEATPLLRAVLAASPLALQPVPRPRSLGQAARLGLSLERPTPAHAVLQGWFQPGDRPWLWTTTARPRTACVTLDLLARPWGDGCRVEMFLRVRAEDPDALLALEAVWDIERSVLRWVMRFILQDLRRELGALEALEEAEALPGDDVLPDARGQVTHGITLAATPDEVWPWLLQMGRRRGGWYGNDLLDNAGAPSAGEVRPDIEPLAVGDRVGSGPLGAGDFEVVSVDPPHSLVLRAHNEAGAARWSTTWAFVLEALDAENTRLHVRARVGWSPEWLEPAVRLLIGPVHHFFQTGQLEHLRDRVEGERAAATGWRDVADGVAGAARMAWALVTPMRRGERARWGLTEDVADRPHPTDALVAEPDWQWTHGIEIDAPPERVWPWVAQIGQDRGGFYSYEWLENLAGVNTHNAEAVHPDWAVEAGGALRLHPHAPPMPVVQQERGQWFVAALDAPGVGEGSWVSVSWLFLVEPLDGGRSRFVSRYRCATSPDAATRRAFGATFIEPIGFAMDRRMLLGVKARAERR